MSLNLVLVAPALVAAAGHAGCSSTRSALGMTKVTPDEFRVVSKAPLVVPPDYALRPPAPGEPRPQELQPESAARTALLGQREAQARSDGEKLLVAKAGADKAEETVKANVLVNESATATLSELFSQHPLIIRARIAAVDQKTCSRKVHPADKPSRAKRVARRERHHQPLAPELHGSALPC